jgi:hypothetical protein
MSERTDGFATSFPDALFGLRHVRLGKCARRILLLAPQPGDEPSVIPAEHSSRAAAESHRRAMRRLAAIGLVELAWKTESADTRAKTRTEGIHWDPEAGVYRAVRCEQKFVVRPIERRAVRLTELGSRVVDHLRPTLETGRRIRWTSIARVPSDQSS